MDDQHRATLKMMADLVERLNVRDAGYQLVLIATDYTKDGDLIEARKFLAMIPQDYVDGHMPEHIVIHEEFAHAVALLVDTFGVDFHKTAKPVGEVS